MRLRTLFGLTVSGVAAVSFLIAWFTGSVVTGQFMVGMLSQEHARQTSALGAIAGASIAANEGKVLTEYLRTVPSVTPKIDYAYIEGLDGRILMHTDPHFVNASAERWRATNGSPAEYTSPVVSQGKTVAVVHVGVPHDLRQSVFAEIRKVLLPATSVIAVIGVSFSLALGFGLAFLLSRPIVRLADAAEEVGRGNLAVRVPSRSSNELGQLTRRFNWMAQRLGEVDEMKDVFIASVSHDLRTPLAAIKMSLDFMLNDDPDRERIIPKHRRTLLNLSENATRLGVFVSNILDTAKMKAGRMEYHPQPVSLPGIVAGLVELYGVVAKNRGLTLQVGVPANFPAIESDPERLERVLTNLLSNAVKFTASGGSIQLAARAQDGAAEVWVQDTGQGISPEALQELFQPFQQADVAAQKAKGTQGSGLGLYIVKQTIESMGGEVGIESEPGKGTRVLMRLPLAQGVLETGRPDVVHAPAAPASKILIVDDEVSFSEMIKQLLESKGYNASIVNEGRLAVAVALREKPALILMDMNLQDAKGIDVIKELKANASTAGIPVLACSANLESADARHAKEVGAAGFLVKPLKAGDLDASIRKALGERGRI
ncbi:MAG: hybrid sensor histidine kinase/response regulator [Elusimicrobia bacterium]|nr:hybrid sensor histidine kinase/response regulator [Elusimicrobiota bacterium]